MFVELIGISGSGKSTAARSAMSIFEAEGFPSRHVGSGYEWVNGPRMNARLRDAAIGGTNAVLRTVQISKLVKDKRLKLRLKDQLSLMALLGQNSRALQFNSGMVVSDQGLLQRFGSFGLRCGHEAAFFEHLNPKKLKGLPWPHQVMFLELEPQVAFERVKARGGRLGRMADQELQVLLERSVAIVKAQAQLAENLNIPVERISANIAPEDVALELLVKLRGLSQTL